MKVAIAKRVDLEARIELEEEKLNEIQGPTYSDNQRNMIEDRTRKLRGELTERNKEIDILKGEASRKINQIKESITKFLDKETGTLGERIRTLFKEQGITIVSILTAIGMAIGVLIEALLGGPSVSTTTSTSGGTSGDTRKGGGAREWIKNKLKALSQLLGKLADKALASLPVIVGSIISWNLMLGLTSCLCSLFDSISDLPFLPLRLILTSSLCSLLDLISSLFFGLTSGLSFSTLRFISKLVPSLKLDLDTSILLL